MITMDHTALGSASQLLQLEDEHVAHNYHPLDVVVSGGSGAVLTDTEGTQYLDFLAAYSANKGAASMLQPVIDNLPDRLGPTRFVAVSTHPAADRRSYARAGMAVDVASQRPVEMAGTVFKNPRRVKETLDLTNKRMADKLGKSELPEGDAIAEIDIVHPAALPDPESSVEEPGAEP